MITTDSEDERVHSDARKVSQAGAYSSKPKWTHPKLWVYQCRSGNMFQVISIHARSCSRWSPNSEEDGVCIEPSAFYWFKKHLELEVYYSTTDSDASSAREFASVAVKDSVLRSRCQCDPPAVLTTKYLNQFMIYKQITSRKSKITYSAKRIPLAQHPNISPSRGNLTHGTPRHIHLNLWDMDIQ